jgi:hypothetical protein
MYQGSGRLFTKTDLVGGLKPTVSNANTTQTSAHFWKTKMAAPVSGFAQNKVLAIMEHRIF